LWSAAIASDLTTIHGELQETKQTYFQGHASRKIVIIKPGRPQVRPKANFSRNCITEIVVVNEELLDTPHFSNLGREGARETVSTQIQCFQLDQ
jgi:hypothetical protein